MDSNENEAPEGQEQLSNEEQIEHEVIEQDDDGEGSQASGEQEALEAEASEAGWKKGGALDAETYLAHKEVLSSKERNKRLIQENLDLKTKQEEISKRLERQEQAAEEYREFQAAAHKREVDRLKSEATVQIADLKQQKAEAIRNGDGDAVLDIDDRIDALKERSREVAEEKPVTKPAPVVEKPQQAPNHPEFDSWVAENEWFKTDDELKETAEAMAILLKRQGDTSDGKVFFDKVKEKVRKLHPDKFGNQNRNKPGIVETSNATKSFKGRSVSDLPDVAKSQMKEFISAGMYAKEAKKLGVSQESLYLKEYFS